MVAVEREAAAEGRSEGGEALGIRSACAHITCVLPCTQMHANAINLKLTLFLELSVISALSASFPAQSLLHFAAVAAAFQGGLWGVP